MINQKCLKPLNILFISSPTPYFELGLLIPIGSLSSLSLSDMTSSLFFIY